MTTEAAIRRKFEALGTLLDERTRRVWAATEASALGYGGVSLVARVTGISRRAIAVGLREIAEGDTPPEGRVRRPGGGRKSAVHHQPDLPEKLESLVEPLRRGDPMSPLRWTCKSTRRLSRELSKFIHQREETKFNGDTFFDFLKKLRQASARAGRRVIVILDNASYHHGRVHKGWREEAEPRFALAFLPPYSPELNPVERVWQLTRRQATHNQYFATLEAIAERVEGQFTLWGSGNAAPRRLCAIT